MHDAAYMLGFFALLSAVLALLRDRLFAAMFGASGLLDVYFAAFRIPDIIFVTVASMVSVFALVPFLESQKNPGDAERVFGNVLLVFSVFLVLFACGLAPFLPFLLSVFFPSLIFGPYGTQLLVLSYVLLAQPVLLGVSTIMTSVVQMRGRYVLYALAPLLYNTSIIAGVAWLYPLFGIAGIAFGVVCGALLHLLIQMPFVARTGFFAHVFVPISWRTLYSLVRLSLPRTLALASTGILLLALTAFAGTFPEGSVSIFVLAFNLQAAPLAIIGASYSVAAFPTLARHMARGENDEFVRQIVTAARHIIFWSLPFLALFVVLRAHIVRVVLGSGAFDWTDTRLVAAAVALFMLSLAAQGLSLLFIRGYYAAGKTTFPLMVTAVSTLVTIVCAFVFARWFEHITLFRHTLEILLRVEDLPGSVVLTLPLAFACGAIVQAMVFLVSFEFHFANAREPLSRVFFDALAGSVTAGFVAHQMLALFAPVVVQTRTLGIFAQGFIAGVVGIIAGVLVLLFLRNQELHEVWHTLHHRFWKARPLDAKAVPASTDAHIADSTV